MSTEPLLTSYRVCWVQKGDDTSRTDTCVIDSNDMTRPGDLEQRNALLRVLEDVIPLCNCEPFPGADCTWAKHKGERFYLATSASRQGFESIWDRHHDAYLGSVHSTLSVEVLTLVREKYGHQ
ncbi:hypothetical protein ACH4Y0_02765 [Streptomyces sp. NPDC020707]|uniref:hypothetical protein n=1 Tax=Streptomyces sp. NPDC020707 TaxID=3365084 RepID=UPI0037A98E00